MQTMINKNKRFWIPCSCGAHGMQIEKDESDSDVYIALWQHGQQPMSIMHKLRWMWSIIEGRPFRDQIVIDQERLQNIIDALTEMKE